jgi:hypothetical protein
MSQVWLIIPGKAVAAIPDSMLWVGNVARPSFVLTRGLLAPAAQRAFKNKAKSF